MKLLTRMTIMALLSISLSGCFLTKLATVPMRLVGAGAAVVGAGISIIPVVGNAADEAIEKVDQAIDETADNLDKVPI